jgi:diguanylate cyclase (GGDEF)-like protein
MAGVYHPSAFQESCTLRFFLSRLIYPFLLPNGLLFAAAVLGLSVAPQFPALAPYLRVFPASVLGVGLFLGWRFNRTRLIFALLLLAITDALLGVRGITAPFIHNALACALPLNLLAVALLRERGLANLRGGLLLVALLAQLGIGAWLAARHMATAAGVLGTRLVPLPFLDRLPLPHPALAVFALTLLVLGIRFYRNPAPLEGSFLWALLAVAIALSGVPSPTLHLAAAGLILVAGVIETSHTMAYRDELTGLPGRRALNESLAKLGNRYTLAMVDIDHFKKFNDKHGHDIGDQVLRMVAGRLAAVTGGGKAFRYGGEEFSVIFPRKAVTDALPHLEALRAAVADARFHHRGKDRPRKKPASPRPSRPQGTTMSVTISIGAAEKTGQRTASNQVLKAADLALYRAKKGGRNQVCG